jgi:two-component system OmpR family sensor kinase
VSFRARMVAAVTAITAMTLGIAFAVISIVETRSQEQHLDRALARAAREEAEAIARNDPAALAIGDRRPLTVNDAGPLAPYAAIVREDGQIRPLTRGALDLLQNPRTGSEPPAMRSDEQSSSSRDASTALFHRPPDACFDFALDGAPLRGLLTAIPGPPGQRLLYAVSRADLDGDRVFLQRAMELVFLVALAWTVGVATWIVRRLTRNQRRIAEVVRRVAAGDLLARVGAVGDSGDEARLARDVDEMVERLAELLSAQRVFIAHAAHELRSPLTALKGELALALRRSRDADAYREAIRSALESTQQLTGLAEDLLAVARLGAAPPPATEPVELRAAVEEAARVVLPDGLAGGVRIEIAAPPAPVSALAWRRDLVRLFRNLLENAVRHSPRGGTVRVAVSAEAARIAVVISDEGAGVPDGEAAEIFAPFYRGTTVPTASGVEVGLGLTIARGIARAYGGDVTLEPASDRGACFRVTLPAAPAADAAPDAATATR